MFSGHVWTTVGLTKQAEWNRQMHKILFDVHQTVLVWKHCLLFCLFLLTLCNSTRVRVTFLSYFLILFFYILIHCAIKHSCREYNLFWKQKLVCCYTLFHWVTWIMSLPGDERGFIWRPQQAVWHSCGQAGGHEGWLWGSEEALQWEDSGPQRRPESSGPGWRGEPSAAETAGHGAAAERRCHPLSAAVLLVYKKVKPENKRDTQSHLHTQTLQP